MSTENNIEHKGTIDRIDNDYVYVKIQCHSACAACHSKNMCHAGEMDEKIIEIRRYQNDNYIAGEEVTILMESSLGYTALILAYLLPFFILLFVLITALSVSKNELIAGLLSLLVLIPYYVFIYTKRALLKRKFEFKIKK